ncbi:MAG: Wzz/FepE/Etk N-terminal domain-containing protein [Erythrobacter sp.]|uniref:GumC family protein n=1 Tax=Erythrobacter sp. TaxID=1042 RepID=UPI002B487688|nr:Wzz/FepE/Etk N-terminal domain-containing protein [Erythrobacter sp.]WRH69218.1 MAG: Wzz/FepE/Etk N-terminal domain-containing protein [Erythrobacter sp.]
MASQAMNSINYDPSHGARRDNQPPLDDERFNLPPILIQYWHTVVRWRWLMVGIVTACVLIGITITLLMAPLYTAKSQLQIDRQQKQITKVEGIEAELPGQDLEFYATQYELLKARPLAERVASELKLYDSDAFLEAHGVDPNIFEQEGGSKTAAELKADRERLVVNTLLDSVEVAPIRMSKLVDINYTSRNAELSSRIANQWAAAFIALSMERQFASTADARTFLEGRLETLRDRLEESERQVVLYAANTGIVALDEIRDPNGRAIGNRTLTGATLEQLANELNQATAAKIAAEARTGSAGGNTAEAVMRSAMQASWHWIQGTSRTTSPVSS